MWLHYVFANKHNYKNYVSKYLTCERARCKILVGKSLKPGSKSKFNYININHIVTSFRFMWSCIIHVEEERTNRWHGTDFYSQLVKSQHVSGIIMPIIRRTDCIKPRVVFVWICWLRLCGAGTRAQLLSRLHTTAASISRQTPHAVLYSLFSWRWA